MTENIDIYYSNGIRDCRFDTQYLYGSENSDKFMFSDKQSQPRYGYLARKALAHYLGTKYNPQNDCLISECTLRDNILALIQFKVIHRLKEYDWEYIDNALRKLISQLYEVKMDYSQKRIDQGFSPIFKSHLYLESPDSERLAIAFKGNRQT